jgi:hypothetical protein
MMRQSANTSTLQELGKFLETEYLGTRQSAEITNDLFDFADSAGYPRWKNGDVAPHRGHISNSRGSTRQFRTVRRNDVAPGRIHRKSLKCHVIPGVRHPLPRRASHV